MWPILYFFINNAILGKTFKQTMAYFTHNPVINEHLLREYFGQESVTEPTLRYSIERHQLNGAGVKDVLKYIRNKANSVRNTAIRVKDRVVNALNGGHRMNFSPHVRSVLAKHGDLRRMNIKVCRKPIHALINTLLNWVSLGSFERNLRALDYDKAMHLYLLFQLENGTVLKFEKNETIAVFSDRWNQSKEVEAIELGSTGSTLNQFLQNGLQSMGPERYFIYDSKTQNCQYWVQWNLRANNLWNDNVNTFVMQDAVAIYKNLGWLEKANRFITDSASKLDNIVFGASVKIKRKKAKII